MIIYLQMLSSEEEKHKFEQLYSRYKNLMMHIAFTILQNQDDTEDAVHQAFLSVAENIHKVAHVCSPETKSYLAIITERKSIDIIRSRSRFADVEFDEALFGIEIPLPGDNDLADAIAKLPPRTREIFLLRFDNGYSTREIACMLDMQRGTVQKIITRKKASLKKALSEKEGIK